MLSKTVCRGHVGVGDMWVWGTCGCRGHMGVGQAMTVAAIFTIGQSRTFSADYRSRSRLLNLKKYI